MLISDSRRGQGARPYGVGLGAAAGTVDGPALGYGMPSRTRVLALVAVVDGFGVPRGAPV